jgi:hypothetical protein
MITSDQVRSLIGPHVAKVVKSFGTTVTFSRSQRGGPSLTVEGPTFDMPFSFAGRGVIVPVSRRTRGYDEQYAANSLIPGTTHVIIMDPLSFTEDEFPSEGDVAEVGGGGKFRVNGASSFSPDGGPSMLVEVQVTK